jgi:hypothetical protein
MGSSVLQESSPSVLAETDSSVTDVTGKRTLTLTAGALGSSVIETACLIVVAVKAYSLTLGTTSLVLLAFAKRMHAPAIRIPFMIFSAAAAVINLYVLWNAWRIRKSPAAQWRMKPLTAREQRRIRLVFFASVFTLVVLIAETATHLWLHGTLL